MRNGIVWLASAALWLSADSATGQCKLIATDPGQDSSLGRAMGLDGDVLIAGAHVDNNRNGIEAGSAYVFRRSTSGDWVQEFKLLASDGAAGDHFGFSVDLSGDVAVIGAPRHDALGPNTGAAYVFRYDDVSKTWVQEAKLLEPGSAPHFQIAWSSAISGDWIILDGPMQSYVYRYNAKSGTWSHQATLPTESPDASVNIDGDTAILAAGKNISGNFRLAFIYQYDPKSDSWLQQADLQIPGTVSPEISFGNTVAVEGDAAIVGVPLQVPLNRGAAYVFRRVESVWSLEQQLNPSDALNHDRFGDAVAIEGDTALVGSPQRQKAGPGSGAAYMFSYQPPPTSGWSESVRLWPNDYPNVLGFGRSLQVQGQTATASAYVFDLGNLPPFIAQHPPSHIHAFEGESVTIEALATADDRVTYQWRRNGEILADGGIFSGATTASLTINPAGVYDWAEFDVVAMHASGEFDCSAAVSTRALLLVHWQCGADVAPEGGDGTVNVDDLLAVINHWGPCEPQFRIDFVPDAGNGFVGVDDLLGVISIWGACP